jgi:hypothetical protein
MVESSTGPWWWQVLTSVGQLSDFKNILWFWFKKKIEIKEPLIPTPL